MKRETSLIGKTIENAFRLPTLYELCCQAVVDLLVEVKTGFMPCFEIDLKVDVIQVDRRFPRRTETIR